LLAVGPHVVPIPGTKRRSYLEENLAAATLELTAREIEVLDGATGSLGVSGSRYSERSLAWVDR
jgi:aryl-alcohol dehydrogenase-like predicted oxidoreductase